MMIKNNRISGILKYFTIPFIMILFIINVSGDDKVQLRMANRHYNTANQYLQKGEIQKARIFYFKCLKINPFNSDASYKLALMNYQEKNFNKALTDMKKGMADYFYLFKSKKKKHFSDTFKIHDEIKRLESIKEEYVRILDPSGNCQSSKINSKIGQANKQIANNKDKLGSSPDDECLFPANYHYLMGNIYYKLKRFPQALEHYLLTIKRKPNHPFAYNNLANLYLNLKQYKKGLLCLQVGEERMVRVNSKFKEYIIQQLLEQENREEGVFPVGIKRFRINCAHPLNPLIQNTYLVFNPLTKDTIIVDPGSKDRVIEDFISKNHLKVRLILNTHGHSDHTGGNNYFRELYGVQVWMNMEDRFFFKGESLKNLPDKNITTGMKYHEWGLTFEAISIPGHSPGSVCYLIKGVIISGDTLFKGSVGKAFGNNVKEIDHNMNLQIKTLEKKLMIFPNETIVLPGHGAPTTLGGERKTNPLLISKSK